jgi:hypothetical protein
VRGRRKDDEATDQRGQSARGSERVREQLAGGAGLPARGRRGVERAGVRVEAGWRWAERGGGARARGGGGRGFGPGIGPAGGEKGFSLFLFIFQNLFPFLHLFLLNKIILWVI